MCKRTTDKSLRRVLCAILLLVVMLTAAAQEYTEHYISELGMSISLPSWAHTTGRKVQRDFEPLSMYGISAAQLEANYKARGIYYNAVWDDGNADMTEIVVSMISDDDTRDLFDLNTASEYQLAMLREQYLSYASASDSAARYTSVEDIHTEQALYLRAEGFLDREKTQDNHLQYMTVINGEKICITLIEHYGLKSDMPENIAYKVSDANADIMEQVISSIEYDKVKKRGAISFSTSPFYTAVSVICVITLLCLAAYEIINRRARTAGGEEKEKDASKTQECVE
ncbi:MAG: hypothetical protein IJP17_05185 [Clostridia bacterium]|nr:hypothetical protein [Clostridia bacterium]